MQKKGEEENNNNNIIDGDRFKIGNIQSQLQRRKRRKAEMSEHDIVVLASSILYYNVLNVSTLKQESTTSSIGCIKKQLQVDSTSRRINNHQKARRNTNVDYYYKKSIERVSHILFVVSCVIITTSTTTGANYFKMVPVLAFLTTTSTIPTRTVSSNMKTKSTTTSTCKTLMPSFCSSSSSTSTSVLYMGVRSRIRNSHSTITSSTGEDRLLSSTKDVSTTIVNATSSSSNEEDPFTKTVTTKDVVKNSNPANSQLMEPKSVSQVTPHQGDVTPSSPKVKVIDYQKSKRDNKKKEQQHNTKKNSNTTTSSKNKSNVTDKSTDTNTTTTSTSARSISYKSDRRIDSNSLSASNNGTTIENGKSNYGEVLEEEEEEDKENVLDAISRLAVGLLPTTTTQQQMDEEEGKVKGDKTEHDTNGRDDITKPKSWTDNNNNNPFDWRPPLNNLSFGSSSLSNDEDDNEYNNDEKEQQRQRRRTKKQKKKKQNTYYRVNPEEAKELDKSVVSFTSTDDAMMGIQVLPTTLSPTVVVASSSSSSSLSNKQRKLLSSKSDNNSSISTSTSSNAHDNAKTLNEKISKRRLIKNWTKEVLQSSSSSSSLSKKDTIRNNNGERTSDVNSEDDDNETTKHMIGGGRINRDIREVAVSIASNIDTIDQYKMLYNEEGNDLDDNILQQIFQSLKVSSRLINVASKEQTTKGTRRMDLLNKNSNNQGKDKYNTPEGFYYYYTGNGASQVHQLKNHHHNPNHHMISNEDIDHAFATACTACRALRDLCALSPELSSIITEAILDASTASISSSSNNNIIPGSNADGTSTRSSIAPGGVVAALASLLEYSINKSNEHHEQGYTLSPIASHHSQNQASSIQHDVNSATRIESSSETVLSSSSSTTTQSRVFDEKARLCRLYIIQLCLAMTLSSDAAVYTLRQIPTFKDSLMKCSSFALYKEPTVGKRKTIWNFLTGERTSSSSSSSSSSTMQTSSSTPKTMIMDQSDVIPVMDGTLDGRLRGASNQLLAALGYNVWVPKVTSTTTTTSSNGSSLDRRRRRSNSKKHKKQQQGLRILCIDGGGTRGIAAITSLQQIVRSMGGIEICDSFDIVAGTSTGAIISFLVALRRETSSMTRKRYDMLIKRIFVKSPLSTPMLVFTTASYDESHFMTVMEEILSDDSMLESRVHPLNPYVFAVSTKMSSTPTTVCLFRNYNYSGGELPDSFVIPPQQAKQELGLLSDDDDDDDNTVEDGSTSIITGRSENDNDDDEYEYFDNDDLNDEYYDSDGGDYNLNTDETKSLENHDGSKRAYKEMLEENTYVRQHTNTMMNGGGSRNPGSFRIPQKVALRATTAAPTVFKPILMSGELYCDGGMLASNPTAIAIHEARVLFPDIPIDCVVSLGTGGFREVKSSPRIGWDGIITQIVNSATDAEQPHHILEDILGQGGGGGGSSSEGRTTKYFRFNPMIGLPDDFPLDNTDPKSLNDLCRITQRYMEEPIQKQKLKDLSNIMLGGSNNSDGVTEEDDDGIRRKSFLKRLLRL